MIRGGVFADWWPDGAHRRYQPPEPGELLAWQHAVWRVVEVRQRPEDLWTDEQRAYNQRSGVAPVVVVVRPVRITSDDPKVRRHDKHLSYSGSRVEWWVYPDEHYPVCGTCGEPTPCRESLGKRIAERAMAHVTRYEQPGVCPSCAQPVTTRQKSYTWHENLEIPGGPPVTFHVGRGGCRWAAAQYDKRWVALNPEQRTPRWYCPGNALNHNDGTYQCTEGARCPSPLAEHESFTACSCRGCRTRGELVNARPDAAATLRLPQREPGSSSSG